ncbi:phosphoglycolate phosphatase [Exophiala viscosa]|uniref:phosphoglycolate phosphatase n=1 Tax=Exophiala viscosa TaxID=2486360 RepID=UPI00219ECEFD|nr:phosphoglycolate phosphatase [Exophiala viscosa]
MSTIPSRETKREPKRFAPLDPAEQNGQHLPKLKGIIFDVDGTLCLPQNYMFKEMRSALGIPKSVDIIDHIRSLSNEPDVGIINGHQPPEPHSSTNTNQPPLENMMSHSADSPDPPLDSPQARAVKKIKDIERQAMTSQRPQPGLQELMAYLTRRGVRKALCTRNFPAPVHHLLSNHLPDEEFHPVVTRETEGIQPKPSPEGLWSIAQAWGLDKEVDESPDKLVSTNDGEEIDPLELARQYLGSGLIMVGDSVDDMAAGYRAGAATVLLVNDENEELAKHAYTGRTVRRLDELIDILEQGFAENLK